ncbi:MAG TPA: hypothetical protein PL001_03540, partial [Candidatus Kryptobacter bacterium]|nr:hypothetical protein [Candidatus Kryptobacter bacterium]
MRKHVLLTSLLLLLTSVTLFAQQDSNIEKEFLGIPKADSCRRNLFILTQQPHVAGSADDSALAVFVKNR